MKLVNLLKMPGGVHEQGRPIKLTLRYLDGGAPATRQVPAVMLPVSEPDIYKVQRAAQATAAKEGALLPESLEYTVRFLQASLRDPGDLSARLIEDENDLQALRVGLVAPQFKSLLEDYKALMRNEYPEPGDDEEGGPTAEEEEALKQEAAGFTDGAPDSPSSS